MQSLRVDLIIIIIILPLLLSFLSYWFIKVNLLKRFAFSYLMIGVFFILVLIWKLAYSGINNQLYYNKLLLEGILGCIIGFILFIIDLNLKIKNNNVKKF